MQVLVKKIKTSLYILIGLFTFGCIKDAKNIELAQSKSKLVVGSFISPQDSILRVTVTKSTPIGDVSTMNNSINNALVIMSNGTISVALTFNIQELSYTIPASSFKIIPGHTYYLNVSTPDGRSVKSSCTIPSSVNTSLTASLDFTKENFNQTNFILRTSWIDIPGEKNYYRISADLGFQNMYYSTPYYSPFYYDGDGNNDLFTDFNNDGGKISPAPISRNNYTYDDTYSIFVKARLLTTDKNYYEYFRTKNNYSGDDPFSEPINIYTNIEGGLGVFAGYQMDSLIVSVQ